MLLSPVGLPISDLDTPALLLDLTALEANIAHMAAHLHARRLHWRPHAKAFKTPPIAHLLRKAGALGLTVAKVSEAEVMAASGIDDILIAHLVVGQSKCARLAALQRTADVKVTVDDPRHLAPLALAATRIGVAVGTLIDIDLGMNRAGVRHIDTAVNLALRVADTPGLRFDGLMGYEGHTLAIPDQEQKRQAIRDAIARLTLARQAVEAAGLPCRIISAGGSGSYQITSDLPGLTELQAGGAIFGCMYYLNLCRVEGHLPALNVLATVVSRPQPDLVILDAGRKTLSDHGASPMLPDFPRSRILSLSAEHASVQIPPDSVLEIGTRVRIIPGYSDLTFVLHDRVLACRNQTVEAVWPLLARGMIQ